MNCSISQHVWYMLSYGVAWSSSLWLFPTFISPWSDHIFQKATNLISFHCFLLIVILNLPHSHNLTDDWSFSLTLCSLPPSLVFRSIPAENVCVCVCVCVCVYVCMCVCVCVCVWLRQLVKPVIECVRPPRCSRDSAVDGFIVSGTIDTYTYSSHASTEPQHWRAISGSSGGVCCYGFCGLTLSLKHNLGVTFARNSNEPKYSVASFIPLFRHQI